MVPEMVPPFPVWSCCRSAFRDERADETIWSPVWFTEIVTSSSIAEFTRLPVARRSVVRVWRAVISWRLIRSARIPEDRVMSFM